MNKQIVGRRPQSRIDISCRPLFITMLAMTPLLKAMYGKQSGASTLARDESVAGISGHEFQHEIRQRSANGTTKKTKIRQVSRLREEFVWNGFENPGKAPIERRQ